MNPFGDCWGKSDSDNGCPDWVKSAADCAPGSYMASNCDKSCCAVGMSSEGVKASPASAWSGDRDGRCEVDYDPGRCPAGQSQWANSREMWYFCPYCRRVSTLLPFCPGL